MKKCTKNSVAKCKVSVSHSHIRHYESKHTNTHQRRRQPTVRKSSSQNDMPSNANNKMINGLLIGENHPLKAAKRNRGIEKPSGNKLRERETSQTSNVPDSCHIIGQNRELYIFVDKIYTTL